MPQNSGRGSSLAVADAASAGQMAQKLRERERLIRA